MSARLADPHALGDGSVVEHDLRSHRSTLPLDGDRPLEVFVTRVTTRDAADVLVGLRVFVAEYRAFHAAAELADGSEDLAGCLVDAQGRICKLDASATTFVGNDPDRLIGLPGEELESAMAAVLGPVVGEGLDLSDGEGVSHHVTMHVHPEDGSTEVHAFPESSGTATRVWLVLAAT